MTAHDAPLWPDPESSVSACLAECTQLISAIAAASSPEAVVALTVAPLERLSSDWRDFQPAHTALHVAADRLWTLLGQELVTSAKRAQGDKLKFAQDFMALRRQWQHLELQLNFPTLMPRLEWLAQHVSAQLSSDPELLQLDLTTL